MEPERTSESRGTERGAGGPQDHALRDAAADGRTPAPAGGPASLHREALPATAAPPTSRSQKRCPQFPLIILLPDPLQLSRFVDYTLQSMKLPALTATPSSPSDQVDVETGPVLAPADSTSSLGKHVVMLWWPGLRF